MLKCLCNCDGKCNLCWTLFISLTKAKKLDHLHVCMLKGQVNTVQV